MAGIYIHIPFCKSRCLYCGFYSTTLLEHRQRYVDALCSEYRQRIGFIQLPPATIYLGGGTPSVLTLGQLEQLFDTVGDAPEVTIECNPDDVTEDFALSLRHLPVNRVSMGAQTFSDERLRFIGRRHNSIQVTQAVSHLRRAGIENISIDLMYGFPEETLQEWTADVETALGLGVEHLSAYALSYEEGTQLWQMVQQGSVTPADEELVRSMYYVMADRLTAAGYEHYEISNFARPGRRSRHNSAYWNHTPYLGLGAAAHSFDGRRRQWNTADIVLYMKGVESGCMDVESEQLDGDTLYNDLVMTALRTSEGLELRRTDDRRKYCLSQAQRYIEAGLLVHDEKTDHLRLSRSGLFVSDMIMADLMMV
jgi:oxygen-independent coproporphyrinogen-3 oxidase